MANIIEHEGGFLRESEKDRATFDHFSLSDWESIGKGKIITDEEYSDTNDITIGAVGIHDNKDGYVHAHYFDKEFLDEIETHMHISAREKYPRDNWRKARNLGRILNAIIRHAVQAFMKPKDLSSKHEAAIAVNAMMMWNAKRNLIEEEHKRNSGD